MFITICTYRARAGEEDAIIALHADWGRSLRPRTGGYLPGRAESRPPGLPGVPVHRTPRERSRSASGCPRPRTACLGAPPSKPERGAASLRRIPQYVVRCVIGYLPGLPIVFDMMLCYT
jgi:hypothetical protein